jgi:hypothetical protein
MYDYQRAYDVKGSGHLHIKDSEFQIVAPECLNVIEVAYNPREVGVSS